MIQITQHRLRGEQEGAKISKREPGIHNVEDEIKHKCRPDLIIHDSGGFEAGDESQMQAVSNFVKVKSSPVRIEERLHVIWYVSSSLLGSLLIRYLGSVLR